jgi:hypothetical protein
MSEKYPHPCCRCGFCCLTEQCPASIFKYGLLNACPALSFQEAEINMVEAVCNLPELVSFGDGCCMKARCFKKGVVYDFAGLPAFVKILMAQKLKEEKEE